MASTVLPTDREGQIKFITQERVQVIQRLAQESRKINAVPIPDQEPARSLLPRLNHLLDVLDKVKMTPYMKISTKIDEAIKFLFSQGVPFHFSPEHQARAQKLYDRWVAENWGAEQSRAAVKNDEAQVKPVPYGHSIWGRDGIMHGLALKRNKDGRKSTVLNREYEDERKDCKVYGHNGLRPGAWFPMRLSAMFHGAHGHAQAGIHGNVASGGAYSIVVSGAYDLLDQDTGDLLYYSGSGSHDNEDPQRPANSTEGTKALDKSVETGNLVRVLRTSEGKSWGKPSEGIRYDGLYTVVSKRLRTNSKGGLFEQFELRRIEDGQPSLEECRKRPNAKELKDFSNIQWGYEGRR